MNTSYYIILILSTALFSFLAITGTYWLLSRMALLDQPEERSNHTVPVVTGMGVAFMVVALSFLMVANAPGNLLWPALGLVGLSFMDDRLSLSAARRLGFHAIAVIIAMHTIKGSVFQGLVPEWVEYPIVAMIWLWFMNLYNFMDGIDELTITQTLSMGVGMVLLGLLLGEMPRFISIDAVVVMAALAAFYPWNKHPARCFMGDAGSIPLGFIMGYLLLNLAAQGQWAAALILPAYYLADATTTLLKRAIAKKPLLQAHSEHYYQQAVRAGWAHDRVSRYVAMVNGGLMVLACVSTTHLMAAVASVIVAYAGVAWVLVQFRRVPQGVTVHEVA